MTDRNGRPVSRADFDDGWREAVRRTSRPVRRVLSPRRLAAPGEAAIHLGPALPPASCGPPADSGGQPSNVRAGPSPAPLDLAPDGVYRAAQVALGAGGLLHHRFTLTGSRVRLRRSAFCGTVPRVTPGGRYPPSCPSEPGRSSAGPKSRRGRPAGSSAVRPMVPAGRSRPARRPPGRPRTRRNPGATRPAHAHQTERRPHRSATPRPARALPGAVSGPGRGACRRTSNPARGTASPRSRPAPTGPSPRTARGPRAACPCRC